MGDMVIVAYQPKTGCDDQLLELVREHVPFLRGLGLVSERPALAMKSKDGVVVEVFEWQAGGIEKAHQHPDVQALWERFAAVCDYVPIARLPEATQIFAEFEPIDL